jgi:branched-chain amino acid transport system substrate-binding protein
MSKTTMTRRTLGAVMALGALCCPVAAMAQAKEPIRVGLVTSQSGPFAEAGAYVQRGIQFAVDEANAKGGIDGRKVELKIADDESNPDAGRRAGEKLSRDGYNLLTGPIASSVSLAMVQNLDRWDALMVDVSPKSDKLTGDSCKARYFRSNHSDAMDLAMVSEWTKTLKEQKFAIAASDYAWGRDSGDSFERSVKAQGKTVVLALYTPLGTKDYAPYLAQLKAANVDAIWVAEGGRDAIAFVKQATEFGLIPGTKLIGQVLITDYTVNATGQDLLGVAGTLGYVSDIDNPVNQAFVAAWKAKYKDVPVDYYAQAYNGMQVLFQGVKAAGSVKPADIQKALSGATLDTIYGTVKMRPEDHQLLLPNFVARIAMVDGKLRPVTERRFPASLIPPPSPLCKM